MSDTTDTWRDNDIMAHYHSSIGEPNRIIKFSDVIKPAPDPIYVVEFAPASDDFDWVYATIGMSRRIMISQNDTAANSLNLRAELMLFSNEPFPQLPQALLGLAVYPFAERVAFRAGDLVAGSPGHGIVDNSPLSEILLTHPYSKPDEFEIVKHGDGTHTHILWVVPIHPSERTFAREHGYLALE